MIRGHGYVLDEARDEGCCHAARGTFLDAEDAYEEDGTMWLVERAAGVIRRWLLGIFTTVLFGVTLLWQLGRLDEF